MNFYRFLFLLLIAISVSAWFGFSKPGKRIKAFHFQKNKTRIRNTDLHDEKLKQKATDALKYVRRKGYNETTCFLLDMSLPSGQNRFFIYDLKADSVTATGLVAHGNCFEYWLDGRWYSNVVGSGCTSLGRYQIGSSYVGKWGYSYKLHGLDSTNNNAFERTVVLHGHSCIPDEETADEICQSNGCPAVSANFLSQLKAIINNSRKPVLLWIYE